MATEVPTPPVIGFSPRVRKSPYFDATRRYGCTAYTVYNHMFMPTGERYKFFYAIDWKNEPAADGDALGWVLLRPTEDGRWIELGYRLRRAAWGAGVATEASKAMLDIAFDHWGVAQVMAVILPGNARSRRVVEKLGFNYRGIDRFYDEDCWLFVLDRGESG